ncbi:MULTISPECIES: DeoR/GlpR family DNA-binding transcription regulator [unclassified Streptomyces]|uniref:DeoR/GlpR family DNA-binding transcription regulator n=1 Tax=unclassified Streptomyces TaxID=2593676 RepID=UPI002DD8040F|nr:MULTISPECIES: DeoR/GlpR family DNA-binding transcription regulator [unclassified Streptomyces]WSB79108.1 DeoR/GlpR family DNA-binding transcription regulator [Streptomyces sp. NBC_01775]WSS12690.1 DeoR/GlpR family DNA-binding transcription regulator [Streptomyces sp. NBC_01186]WSS41474.1 DeoR/GlpR family DNA-binding transcription regulator [Streptomyces sp. NBC_01187]
MPARTRLSQAAVEQRRQNVLRYVVEHGEIRIDDLAARFDVSLMTVHRDLDDLAGRRLLRKERGRAVAFPALTMETATRFRESVGLAAKTALCAAAARWIRPGSTVLIDDSTTLYPLAGMLAGIDQLTVVTNSVGLAQRLGPLPGVDVTLLGGHYHSDYNSCTGPEVARVLSRIHAGLSLMSASAVLEGRLFHPVREYVEVKEAMLASIDRALLLVDHSKFGKTATHAYGTVTAYHSVLTDTLTPDEEITAIRGLDTPVEIVDPGEHPS